MQILYLHGFASSPSSAKAAFLCERLSPLGHIFIAPDLNLPTFENLSFEGILAAAEASFPAGGDEAVAIIGSSLGGFAALHLLTRSQAVRERTSHLVLLAPAFNFKQNKQLTPEIYQRWREQGEIPVFHHSAQREKSIHYQFLRELEELTEPAIPGVKTLIIHGKEDEVIDIRHSREFSRKLPCGELIELDSDHKLLAVLPAIGDAVERFLVI